jgi:hypothetical protein
VSSGLFDEVRERLSRLRGRREFLLDAARARYHLDPGALMELGQTVVLPDTRTGVFPGLPICLEILHASVAGALSGPNSDDGEQVRDAHRIGIEWSMRSINIQRTATSSGENEGGAVRSFAASIGGLPGQGDAIIAQAVVSAPQPSDAVVQCSFFTGACTVKNTMFR